MPLERTPQGQPPARLRRDTSVGQWGQYTCGIIGHAVCVLEGGGGGVFTIFTRSPGCACKTTLAFWGQVAPR